MFSQGTALSACQFLLLGATLAPLSHCVPVQDNKPHQRPLDGGDDGPPPYTPSHRDPYDGAVDSVGRDLDPLPWRGGRGASVLGPWNRGRARQNPDVVRPPSTDHGDMPSLRWSFADSHVRIEVR